MKISFFILPSADAFAEVTFVDILLSSISGGMPGEEEADSVVDPPLDDLEESGLLKSTLVVMAGEFGRTPKIFGLPAHYKLPGRDHWGAVQSVFFAGAGIPGGTVVGSSDKNGDNQNN